MTSLDFFFTFIPLFYMFNIAKSTNFKGSFDTAGGPLMFANPVPFHRHQLSSVPIKSQEVEDEKGCIFACVNATKCQSVNFKTFAEDNKKYICHLLDADKFVFPELLSASVWFHHYSFTAPCENNPCLNAGICHSMKEEYDFKCTCRRGLDGKRCNISYQSCAELLNAGYNKSGVYQIKPSQSEMFSVYCDQTSRGGGWTMVFKVVSGVSADIYQLWSSADTLSENKLEALNMNSLLEEHYKNRLVQEWLTATPAEARVALYKDQNEILSVVFDATNSDNENWFTQDRMTFSPWTDLYNESPYYFSIAGNYGRRFYINKADAGCSGDNGWLELSAVTDCVYESRFPRATILYSKLQTSTLWNVYDNVGVADVLVVYIR